MSSESTPVVIIDYDNPSGFYWDVSTITTKIVYEYGRNRPFALAEVVVKKAYFNSDTLYWNNVARCPKDSAGKVILPNITLGETKIHIEAYGESYNMYIEKMTSNEDYITLLCYNSAYKLKSALYLSSLTNVFIEGSNYYLESDPLNPLNPLPSADNRLRLEYKLKITDPQYVSIILNCILIDASTIKVDYIEGLASDVFRFVAINGAGYDAGNCIVDEGYSYNYNIFNKEGTDLILNEYSEDQIVQIKSAPYITPSDDYVKLRVNYLCWDVIKALGYLSNRYAFFYDRAYFIDYNNSAYCSKFKEMVLDYGLDENGNNKSYTMTIDSSDQPIKLPLDIYAIVDSLDQGTTYVMSGQEVASENHSDYVHITDAVHPIEGTQIVFPYPESFSEGMSSNAERDRLTRKLALERLVTNYRPLDCIQFTISEIGSGSDDFTPKGIVTSYDELPANQPLETIYQVTDGLMNSYYIYRSGGWEPYIFATYNTRKSRFDVYSCVEKLVDRQNNIEMVNAPLSYVQLSWPECVTTLSFGNPEFIDSAWQLSNLEQGKETSVAEGTTDLSISDRQAAKIVVGNQTLSELNDDRTGFTGLILEKNRDKELYRLSGYNNGQLEAFFDSKGRILSGNASFKPDSSGELVLDSGVMIDHTGIKITGSKSNYVEYDVDSDGNKITNLGDFTMSTNGTKTGTIVLDSTGLKTYSNEDSTKPQCQVDVTGSIIAGGGRVRLNKDGIFTYKNASDTTPVCYINSNGEIVGTRAIFATSAGSATTAGSADTADVAYASDTNYVVIDSDGLRTYSSTGHEDTTLQCEVGSNGAMTAGAGAVRLNSTGITINRSSASSLPDNSNVYVRFNSTSNTGNADNQFIIGTTSAYSFQASKTYQALSVQCMNTKNNSILYNSQLLLKLGAIITDADVIVLPTDSTKKHVVTCITNSSETPTSDVDANKWYYILCTNKIYESSTDGWIFSAFMECGGYLNVDFAGHSGVRFPVSFTQVRGCECTTIRSTRSDDGNDYVYDVTNEGASLKHDKGSGVYWRAWGIVYIPISHLS